MFAPFYKLLSKRLRDKMPELKQIALFMNQYNLTEEELPLFPPCCFIEFGEIPWRDTGLHIQEGDAEISFHLVMDFVLPTDNFDLEGFNALEYDTKVLDLMQKLHLALQGWDLKDQQGRIYTGAFTRSGTRPEPDAGGLSVWVVTYRCNVVDNSAYWERNKTEFIIPKVAVRK